jgi:hypothetical protein
VRNLLAFFAAALLTFAGLGWYLDWYTISSKAEGDGHRQVNINLNTSKIGEDIEKGEQKVRKMLEKSGQKDGAAKDEPKANDPNPQNKSVTPENKPKS